MSGFQGSEETVSKYPAGVFVNRVVITGIEQVESQYDHDISLKVTGDTPDNTKSIYPTTFYLNGNHSKVDGVPNGWGSSKSTPPVKNGSWKIKQLLQCCGVAPNGDVMTEDFKGLNEKTIEELTGKGFYILQYKTTKNNKNGNPIRQVWHFMASESEGADALLNKWNSFSDKPHNFAQEGKSKLAKMFNADESKGDDLPW